jgi:hypothetical protein
VWIECKLRASWAIFTLWRETKAKAAKVKRELQGGHKVPVLLLAEKGKPGHLIVVHEDDLSEVAAEYLAARDEDAVLRFEAAVRSRRLANSGEDAC